MQMASIQAAIGFPHARLTARHTRTRVHIATGRTSQEAVYAITNLGWGRISPTQLLVMQEYFFLQPVIAGFGVVEMLLARAWLRRA